MWKYYKQVFGEALKSMLTKGPIIFGIFKGFMIFGLPPLIGTIAVDNIWTRGGFLSNWYWLVGPLIVVVFLFWAYEALNVNFKNVEIVRPNLIIDYKEGELSYQQWDPSDSDPQYKLHRIRIFNDGLKPVNKITAQIQTITPQSINRIRGLPMELHIMGRDAPAVCNTPEFDLNGQSEKFIDVIALGRREYNQHNLLYPVGSYPNSQAIWLTDDQDYELNIIVFADGTKYCEKIFRLEKILDENKYTRHRFIED